MRYRKGMIFISDSRDIPLLLLIRDSRAISISQLIDDLMFDAIETNSRSIHWRLNRLIASGFVEKVATTGQLGSRPMQLRTMVSLCWSIVGTSCSRSAPSRRPSSQRQKCSICLN